MAQIKKTHATACAAASLESTTPIPQIRMDARPPLALPAFMRACSEIRMAARVAVRREWQGGGRLTVPCLAVSWF